MESDDRRAARRIFWAIQRNETAWVNDYPGVLPWDEILALHQRPASLITSLVREATGESIEEGLLALVECAIRDGRTDLLETYELADRWLPMPCLVLITKRYDRLLLKYLEAGFDPEQVIPSCGWNALQATENMGYPQVAGTMRAYLTRSRIQAALDSGSRRPAKDALTL